MSEIQDLHRCLAAGAALLLCLAVPALRAQSAAARPVELRCEYRANPAGIDAAKPRLSWALAAADASARGVAQSAYRVVVASTEDGLKAPKGDLWDTGKVASDQSIQLVYGGKPLESGKQAFWRVQIWDQAGKPSAWSETARWSMGLLKAADWKAKWIGVDEKELYRSRTSPFWSLQRAKWLWSEAGAATGVAQGTRYFRAKFTVPAGRPVKRAYVVMAADNEYELNINGVRIGKGTFVHMPDVQDFTGQVKPGVNILAASAKSEIAGFEGFRTASDKKKPAGLIGTVRVEFVTGEPMLFQSGAGWKVSTDGSGDWKAASFDDSNWAAATELGVYGMKPWGEAGFAEERVLPARMVRKEFDAKPGLKRATAYLSGIGLSELYLNGAKVSDHVLSPGLTDYDKRVLYVTHDVTAQVKAGGKNAVGVMLGNGRYYSPRSGAPIGTRTFNTPRLLLQLELEYADGTEDVIASDESWKASTRGPVRANNEYDGEEYDARMEMPGWDKPAFAETGWEPAQVLTAPKGVVVAQMAEPLRVVETLKPVNISRVSPGRYIFDMGQNMVGWVRIKVSGPVATRIMLRHAETALPDGRLYLDNLRSARATDFFTLRGAGTEIYEPRFTYHGFRYVELSGFPGEPTVNTIEGRVVHDAMPRAGDWTSSNPLLNKLHKNIFWGVRGNYRSIPTDCPQRDERQGWLGDRSVVSRSESYLYDIAAFYSKWVTDIADSQKPTGSIPDVAPAFWTIYSNNMTWPSTFVLAPGMLYDQYGDVRVIERNYPAMKKWLEYMRTTYGKDGIITKDTYGDWCVPPESPELIHSKDPARKTDGSLLSTAYYIQMLKMMSRYATMIGRKQDVAEYEALGNQMRAAFEKKFFHADKMQYDNGTQTSSIIPLAFDIVAPENRKAVFDHLVRKIETESNYHVGVGLVGAQWLMRTLCENGRADLAYTIATQTTYPGWGYMIEKGATTVWELWNGDTADPAMNSGNHVMQIGDLNVWLYEYLAGISADPGKPGFKHAIIRPYPVPGLQFVKASHKSLYGTIASEWKRDGAAVTLNVTVPPNTTATVYMPAAAQPSTPDGAKFLRMEGGRAVFDIASGSYSFTARQ